MSANNKYLRYTINYDGEGRELPLNMPNLCPICLSPEIAGKSKITDSSRGRKYVSIPLCSEHYHADKIGFYKLLVFPLMAAIPVIIIYLITRNQIIRYISLFLFLFFCLFFDFKYMSKVMKRMKRKKIRDYLDIKYTKNIITVLIKLSDWAEAFKKLNNCEYYELDEQLIEEIISKQVKIVFAIVIWVVFSLFMLVITRTIIQQEWFSFLFDSLFVIGILTLFFLLFYFLIKEERLKTVGDTSEWAL
jgi:hypothetical protein